MERASLQCTTVLQIWMKLVLWRHFCKIWIGSTLRWLRCPVFKPWTLECVTDCLMNLCVSVGVFPMSTQKFITTLCSTLFENVVFSDEEETFNCAWSCEQVHYIKDNGTWNFSSRTTHESHLCTMGTHNVITKSIGAKSGLYIFFPKDFVTFAFFDRGVDIFPLTWLLLCFRVIVVKPCFICGY
jgi:hypothetical protein